jgi:uncharacterized membrane protein required for colicin V production
VLDLLMGLVLLMFVPIGLWRGALREWLTLAGIALGGLLASSWGGAWGDDLSRAIGMDANLAAFTVATAFFLGTTLVVGYGGGVTLPYRPDLTGANRALGALLGLANGTMILSGLLQLMQRHLFAGRSDSPLKTAGLAAFLIDSVGWVYLGLLLLLLGFVVAGLARRATEGTPLMDEYGPVYAQAARADQPPDELWNRTVPPVKPAAQQQPPPAAARAQEQTAVLSVVKSETPQSPKPTEPESADRPQSPPVSAAPQVPNLRAIGPIAPTGQVVDIARRQGPRATPPPLPANVTPLPSQGGRGAGDRRTGEDQRTLSGPGADDRPTLISKPRTIGDAPTLVPQGSREEQEPARTPAAPKRDGERICPSCGTSASARSRFCLICGHIIGEPEKRQVARHP